MSTKIYTAYRAKPEVDLWKLVPDIFKRGTEEATRILKSLYETVQVVEQSAEFQRNLQLYDGDHYKARLSMVHSMILTEYGESQSRNTRDFFDLDVSVAIREHQGRLYLTPHCDMYMQKCLDFLKAHPALEEFGYWDTADKPHAVLEQEWEERKEIWNVIIERWEEKLILDIVSFGGFFKIDPFMDLMMQDAEK